MFRYSVILFILLSSLLISSLSAQTIETITVEGNKNFDQDDYVEWSRLKVGSTISSFTLDSAKKNISLELSQRGFFNTYLGNSSIHVSPDSLKAAVKLSVIEGNSAIVKEINIRTLIDSSLFYDDVAEVEGKVYDYNKIETLTLKILDIYENRGYPFAKIKISSVQLFRDTINIHIDVDTGKFSRIDRIEIEGNTKTRDFVILRALELRTGMPYSQKIIDEIPEQLNRLRFFEPVLTPEFYLTPKGEGVLKLTVRESQTNNFDGIIGYVPGEKEGSSSGYLTGLVNINLRNLLGTGRNAGIKWQKMDRYSQELDVRYTEPWIFGFPFNISVGLYQLKQDTTYVNRKLSSSLEFIATPEISASLFLQLEDIIPTLSDYRPVSNIVNSSLTTTGVNLKIDTRNDLYAPTRGIFFLNSYYYSLKKIKQQNNNNLQRLELDLSLFYELFRHQVGAVEIHGRELRGSFVEVSDLYRLGGAKSLRGYLENQFLANRIFWTNTEYRLLFTRRSYGFLFFDAGYYLRNADKISGITRSSAVKTGYGFGLNIETQLGILGVSYALAKGDALSDGKIHFGFVGEF